MKILYYDCFAGLSGDMNLAAMIDLGVPADYLLQELEKLNLEGYHIEISKSHKLGIHGTRVDVLLNGEINADIPLNESPINPVLHSHGHGHGHGKHHHPKSLLSSTNNPIYTSNSKDIKPLTSFEDQRSLTKMVHHEHRNLSAITEIINKSKLSDWVKEKSLAIFNEIGLAEAKIHAKNLDEIHFHEVGAIDSIIDIVGAAICIDYLKPDKILCSTVELGGGFVNCAHGRFPVPAPATFEILKNVPVKKGAANKETTTPTGAAILKVLVNEFIDRFDFIPEKIAYGIGHRDLEIPNVVRVFLAQQKEDNDFRRSEALILECNIDDMNPEHYDFVIEKLFNAGAQDVYMVPIIMKKSRPAVQLNVLCDSSTQGTIENILLTETTSLGLRYLPVNKAMLNRSSLSIETRYGLIRVKEALLNGKSIKFKAEYDDCQKAALQHGVSLNEVYREVDKVYYQKYSQNE